MMLHFKFKKSTFLYVTISLIVLISICWAETPKVLENKQPPAPVNQQKPSPEIDPASIELKIKSTRKRLAESQTSVNEQTAQQLGTTLSRLQERTVKLKELESVYQRLLTALKKKKTLEKEEALFR